MLPVEKFNPGKARACPGLQPPMSTVQSLLDWRKSKGRAVAAVRRSRATQQSLITPDIAKQYEKRQKSNEDRKNRIVIVVYGP